MNETTEDRSVVGRAQGGRDEMKRDEMDVPAVAFMARPATRHPSDRIEAEEVGQSGLVSEKGKGKEGRRKENETNR